MPRKSLAACNAMILGFRQSGMVAEVREIFARMVEMDDDLWTR